MDCDFIIENEADAERPSLSGWETVVFELEDDPEDALRRSDSARGGAGADLYVKPGKSMGTSYSTSTAVSPALREIFTSSSFTGSLVSYTFAMMAPLIRSSLCVPAALASSDTTCRSSAASP